MKLHKKSLIEKAVSKDPTRPVLHSPYLDTSEPGAPVMVATDGKILAVIPVEDLQEGEGGRIPCAVITAARKEKDWSEHSTITATQGERKAFCLSSGVTLPDTTPPGNYPNWRNVLPKGEPKAITEISFNPILLLTLAQAMAAGEGVTLRFTTDSGITVVPIHNKLQEAAIPGAKGVLMPIRVPTE